MKKFTLIFLLFIFITVVAHGQTATGRIVGTVSEANGAVVPGATVVITDTKTAKERTVTANNDGGFTVPLLDVGVYTVKVSSKGFKTTVASVTIQVGQEYSLAVQLDVGDVSENVTVTGEVETLNATNGELSSTLTNRQITELPLATRNPLALILTQAGSASNPSQGTSINGGRTSSTNITRDGVNINDNFIRSNATDFAAGRPSVDNVEEFTLSSQSAADSGFGSGQVQFVTPRGGNGFHGAGWEYNRNSAVGANSWFNNAAGTARPYRNRNQYGFKVGGPVLKNKLFFWLYAEKLNDIVTASKLVTVLTPTARQGVLRYTVGGVTYGANLFTPGGFTTGASGNAVPTAINSLVNTQILAALPAGNSTETGDLLNTMGYRFAQHNDQTRKSFTSRIDYDLNSKNNINAVLDYQFEGNLRGDLDTVNVIPKVNQPAKPIVYSGGWRFSPTANISNELRVGRFYSAPVFLSDISRSEWETVPLFTNPDPLNGAAIFRNQGRFAKNWNIQDTITWLTGNHSFRFGAQYQYVHIDSFNDAGNQPTYAFGLSTNGPVIQPNVLAVNACGNAATCPVSTAVQTTAKSLYAVLGGVLTSGSLTFNPTSSTSGFVNGATSRALFKYSMIAPYAVDQWKLRPDLTLNIGLRWDYQRPLESENQLFFETVVNGDPVAATLDPAGSYQIIGGNAGHSGWFYKRDLNNWAPSFGVAWAPKFENGFLRKLTGDDFVIRGGYRKSYVNDELVRAPQNAFAGNAGLGSTPGNALVCFTVGCTPSSAALDDRFGAAHQSVIGTPTFISTRAYTTNNTAAVAANLGTVFTIDPKLQTPDQNDYSVGIQRRFGKWVAEMRYVGGMSHNMLRTIDYNQVVVPAQYKTDFATVRANVLAGCPAIVGDLTAPTGSAKACANGAVLFNQMNGFGGITASLSGTNLTTNTLGTFALQGQMAELIWQQLGASGTALIPNLNVVPYPSGTLRAQFLPNPNTGVANVLGNGGSYMYNAAQFELRRQFSQGLYLQANYTFSKELTDAIGTGQTRVEPFLDNANEKLDYTRADYDQTHVFNLNAIYELPFGKGRRFLNENGWLDQVVGGWQVGVVWRLATGAPLTITDARGTLNRSVRSTRQTALTTLTESQLKNAIGVFKTPCGIYWIDPKYININHDALAAGNCSALTTGAPTVSITGSTATTTSVGGAASSGFGIGAWGANQVFFNNGPGQTSGLRRAFFNGPILSSADLSIIKNFKFKERVTFQVRGEMFNFLNTPYFAPTQFGTSFDINNTNFGKVTGVSVGARVVQFAGRLTF